MSHDAGGGPEDRPPPSLSDLVLPRRPAGISYAEGDDADARALLAVNDYPLDAQTLIGLLEVDLGILQAAAARVLGTQNEQAAEQALQRLAADDWAEETARVQAAYALARMGIIEGREWLVRLFDTPLEASPAPMQAAGALALLDDPRGFEHLLIALESSNPVTAMVACKQLYAFAPLDGLPLPSGGQVEVYGAFRRALERPEARIGGEARAQLAELDTAQAQALLSAYPPPAR